MPVRSCFPPAGWLLGIEDATGSLEEDWLEFLLLLLRSELGDRLFGGGTVAISGLELVSEEPLVVSFLPTLSPCAETPFFLDTAEESVRSSSRQRR